MSDPVAVLDACAQAELVRQGEASPSTLVDAAIARIARLDPTLNAVIHRRFEQARAEARAADAAPARGPFHGVPIVLKDIMGHSRGDPLHLGTRVLRDLGFMAPHDAYLTAKLKAAGFIVVGRTNTPELGTLPTTEPEAYGPSRNPWNPKRSPGGSSGGSAAAVASGMVPVGHANDGGGSIRIPASACGLVGLKPSRGRTSFGPDAGDPMGGMVSEGVLTRSVRDTAAVLDVIAGAMPGDPYTAPPPSRPFAQEVGAPLGPLRIGCMRRVPANLSALDPECATAVEAAADLLRHLGHQVETAYPPALDESEAPHHLSVMFAGATARMLDVLAMLAGRPIDERDVDPLNWALAQLGRACTVPQYLAALEWMHGYTRRLASWWAEGFDLLLTPTLPAPPPPLGFFHPTRENFMEIGARAQAFAAFTSPFNMSGQPAISLPLHWTRDGLPVGLQLVAAYAREDLLIRVAAQLEEAQPWAGHRPAVHA